MIFYNNTYKENKQLPKRLKTKHQSILLENQI